MMNEPIVYKFFKDFTTHRLEVDFSPTFLNAGTRDEIFYH